VRNHIIAPGTSKEVLDTPALVLDLDLLEANIARMAATFRRHAVAWRPHVKAMKVPALAHKLVAAGAIGVTCAKLGEAEVMAAAGVRNILIANQIVGPGKIARLAALSQIADAIVAVDDADNVAALARAAQTHAAPQRVVIEVDTGLARAGIQPGDACLALAQAIIAHPTLKFSGLMTWEGHTAAIRDPAEKARQVELSLAQLVMSAETCRRAGIPVEIVSCGGTGTYWLSAACPGITEIQAGGGVFGDVRYRTVFGVDHPCALTVLATVTSRPNPRRIVCDTGKKAMSVDAALPSLCGVEHVIELRFSAEHTTIELSCENRDFAVGQRLEFVVGYSDTTVMLHDELYAVRGNRVESIWPIMARKTTR
jgi:D-serine deaminase-like pyridoxal phosphate-dependent protein